MILQVLSELNEWQVGHGYSAVENWKGKVIGRKLNMICGESEVGGSR